MKRFIDFLGSFRFAGIVLSVIIILSIIGSLIPQGGEAAVTEKLTAIFGANGEKVYSFLKFTGFSNIYSSYFFIFLIFLFGLSLAVRTWRLLPFALQGFSGKNVVKFDNVIDTALTKEGILDILKKRDWRTVTDHERPRFFKTSKYSIGRFGVVILHAGILVVMIGALIGYIGGYKGFMNILEGDSDNVAVLPSGDLKPLGFDVACDDFNVEYYDNSTRAKSYTSIVTIKENGVEVKKATIDVNHPLKHKGVVLYQTSFGYYPNKNAKAIFSIKIGSEEREYAENFNKMFKIKGDYVGKIVDFAPTLAADEEGRIYSASDEIRNPAVLLEVYEVENPVLRGWVLKNNPSSGDFKELGFKLDFKGLYGTEYTGLSVKKDPGTPIVYMGFLLIILGVIFVYLPNYTVVFFEIEEKGNMRVLHYTVRELRRRRVLNPSDEFPKLFDIGRL